MLFVKLFNSPLLRSGKILLEIDYYCFIIYPFVKQFISTVNVTLDADSANSCLTGPEDEEEVINDNTAP